MSQIKITRARRLAKIGAYPESFSAMLTAIPSRVVASITSAALAEMIDAMWATAQQSKQIVEAEACSQGYIWDARAERMRDLAA